MYVFLDVFEMIVEIELDDIYCEKYRNKYEENILYKIDDKYSKITKIYDIFENIIYDFETKNNELHTNFILTFVNERIRFNENCCYFYINKSIVVDKCINYIFFINNDTELKQKYSISSYIKLFNDDNAKIFEEFYHNSGKKEGIYKRYCDDKLIEKTNYIDNKKEGKSYHTDIYNNGNKSEFDYVNDTITHFITFNDNNDNNEIFKIFEMNYDINSNKGTFIDYKKNLKYSFEIVMQNINENINGLLRNLSYYGAKLSSQNIIIKQL